MNPCEIPTIPYGEEFDWLRQHDRYVLEAKHSDPDVILIGASIIEFIENFPIWKNKFEPLRCLNFGIAGDLVQNVLWRVKNTILDDINPKVAILNVGSNNIDCNSPAEISEGILAIVNEIRLKLPECYIIIIGILPRGAYPNPSRNLADRVNQLVSRKVKNMSKVELFIANLLQPDGSLSEVDAPDYLHPSEIGYTKIFNPIFECMTKILKD